MHSTLVQVLYEMRIIPYWEVFYMLFCKILPFASFSAMLVQRQLWLLCHSNVNLVFEKTNNFKERLL